MALRLFGSFLTLPHCPRFKTANDEEGTKGSGLSPLLIAALSGNVEVARALVAEHKADVRGHLRDTNSVTGFDAGSTPLHACMCFNPREDMQALLLNSGADLNAPSKSGL
jgi:ankyrin repeat protein